MTAIPSEGWQRLPPGELDRLEGRLRWRRWVRYLVTAAAIAVVVAAAGLGAVQAITLVSGWNGSVTPPCSPPATNTGDGCTSK
jgi:hypothetical protein